MPVSGMANTVLSVATLNRPCTDNPTPWKFNENNVRHHTADFTDAKSPEVKKILLYPSGSLFP